MRVIGFILAVVLLVVFVGMLKKFDFPHPDTGAAGNFFRPFAVTSSTIVAAPTGMQSAGGAAGRSASYRLVRFYAVSPGPRGFVILKNTSTQTIALIGWRIGAQGGGTAVPSGVRATAGFYGSREEDIVLGPGESFAIYAGAKSDYGTSYAQPSEWAGWAGAQFMGSIHDTLTLRDRGGALVDTYQY